MDPGFSRRDGTTPRRDANLLFLTRMHFSRICMPDAVTISGRFLPRGGVCLVGACLGLCLPRWLYTIPTVNRMTDRQV